MHHQPRRLLLARSAPLVLIALAACGGPSSTAGANGVDAARPRLQSASLGRLVDIYAYQRIDTSLGDRRNRFNRQPVLMQRDVAVNPNLETQSLFDPAGDEVASANYEFRPFDIKTGHEDLLILWDNRGIEGTRFQTALANAQLGLTELPPSFRNQNTTSRPMPVVARNAAIVLEFSGPVNVDDTFFEINPGAVQLLEFRGDPAVVAPQDAFSNIPVRTIARGDKIILDPTILGGEANGGNNTPGMPISVDNVTANIRIAIPSRGSVSPAFYVRADDVPELNGIDSNGRTSVIRDFRSGNAQDGAAGVQRDLEAPMIVASLDMGITSVDNANGIVTLNKRFHVVPIRGRYPFVEGDLSPSTGLPFGPAAVPTVRALRSGDFLVQNVNVTLPTGQVESVRVRAEILQNIGVGTVRGDPAFPGPGLAPDGTQGETAPTAQVRLASVFAGTDSAGRPVAFQAGSLQDGADCVLRPYYYENVRYRSGGTAVSDAGHRLEFLSIDPKPPVGPTPPNVSVVNVDPLASFAIEFSEPVDFDRIDGTTNLVIANATMPALNGTVDFATQITNPKAATSGIVPTRLSDQSGDGTVLQLHPQLGLFHKNTQQEIYWFHLLVNNSGLTDLGGNPIDLFSDPSAPVNNWSVSSSLASDAPNNLVGWHVYRFEDADEDGTLPGSIDIFGQYRLLGGQLIAASAVRFSRTADSNNLGAISRNLRGECWQNGTNPGNVPFPLAFPYVTVGGPVTGFLYLQPRMIDQVLPPNVPPVYLPPNTPQLVGRVIEPHQPRGSRMMMRYLEDDFSLSSRLANEFMIDVEQLYWSTFNDEQVLFDVFDRYTMALSHGDRRPDEHFSINPGNPGSPGPPPVPPVAPFCQLDCASISSSLSSTFLDNPLQGTTEQSVFDDKSYTIDPNSAFRSPFNVKYVPYPKFSRTYTWRDSRLVTVQNGEVIGLTGAHDPTSPEPNNDFTANMDSPWITSQAPQSFLQAGFTTWVMDEGDFRGDRKRDHDPIAAPLIVDFKVFPDNPGNGIARGTNGFQVAMLGPPSSFVTFPPPNTGGYYNSPAFGVGCPNRDPWPLTRVHKTGGFDPTTLQNILVDPGTALTAAPSWIKDAGAIVLIATGFAGDGARGIFQAPPGDGMINWAQADFVRKVSSMTFGFIDTLQPNVHMVSATVADPGIPDFFAIRNDVGDVAISDFVSQLDPPLARQPAGTSTVLEIRGASTIQNAVDATSGIATALTMYNPNVNDTLGTTTPPTPARGNLLNANYACEAFRYSKPNSGPAFDTPRVATTGLTAYVTEDRITSLREAASGLLPRFLNFRLIMTNNIAVTPALSPALRSMSVVYRMQRKP